MCFVQVFRASVSGNRYLCSKFITGFRFRCESVLPVFPDSCLCLESGIGCFHGIDKWGDCEVMVFHITFMLALFNIKRYCNFINLFPCILWDLIIIGLVLS